MKLSNPILLGIWEKIDYFQNYKLFDDVYGILDASFMIYIAFGMTPFQRYRSHQGNFIYYSMDWKKYLLSAWYSVILLLSLTMIILKALEDLSINLNVSIYLSFQTIFAILTINVFARKSNTLLKAYGNCYKADKILKELGFQLEYKVIHRLTLFGATSIIFFAIMNLVLHLLWKKSIIEFIRFCVVYSLPCAITVISVYHFFYLATVALLRLKTMNNFLAGDLSRFTKRQIEDKLWAFASVHSELCNAINNVLDSSGTSVVSFYIFTYVQVSVLVLGVMNIAHLTLDIETYLWNTICIITTACILVLATILRHEASRTSYALCELTAAFFDDGIGIRRNTFLLQLLHQKINLRIYGNFDVHLARVLSDLQALMNLLMFVSQLKN